MRVGPYSPDSRYALYRPFPVLPNDGATTDAAHGGGGSFLNLETKAAPRGRLRRFANRCYFPRPQASPMSMYSTKGTFVSVVRDITLQICACMPT